MRTLDEPGSQAADGMRTSYCLRTRSTRTDGAGTRALPVTAAVSSAVAPCTVRNHAAGELTPACAGQATGAGEEPSATVKAVRAGSTSELTVTRRAVALRSARTRNSTRSAALLANTLSVG